MQGQNGSGSFGKITRSGECYFQLLSEGIGLVQQSLQGGSVYRVAIRQRPGHSCRDRAPMQLKSGRATTQPLVYRAQVVERGRVVRILLKNGRVVWYSTPEVFVDMPLMLIQQTIGIGPHRARARASKADVDANTFPFWCFCGRSSVALLGLAGD